MKEAIGDRLEHAIERSADVEGQIARGQAAQPGRHRIRRTAEYRMLVQAGQSPAGTLAGLTAANLLVFGFVLALPVLALPALVRGGVDRSLLDAAIVALAVLVALCVAGVLLLGHDRRLAWVGRAVQRARNPRYLPRSR